MHIWKKNVTGQELSTWRGQAFEIVCFTIFRRSKGTGNRQGSIDRECMTQEKRRYEGNADLIINRRDNTVNMCELKFCSSDFTADGIYYRTILSRAEKHHRCCREKCCPQHFNNILQSDRK